MKVLTWSDWVLVYGHIDVDVPLGSLPVGAHADSALHVPPVSTSTSPCWTSPPWATVE